VHLPHVSIDSSPTRIDNLRARTGSIKRLPIFFWTRAAFGSTIAVAPTLDSIVANKQRTTATTPRPRATIHDFATIHATTVQPPETPKTRQVRDQCTIVRAPLRGFEAHAKQRTRGARITISRTHYATDKKRARSISCSGRSLLTSSQPASPSIGTRYPRDRPPSRCDGFANDVGKP